MFKDKNDDLKMSLLFCLQAPLNEVTSLETLGYTELLLKNMRDMLRKEFGEEKVEKYE